MKRIIIPSLIGGLALLAAAAGMVLMRGEGASTGQARVTADSPKDAACGEAFTISVRLDSIEARRSALGIEVGLASFDVKLLYDPAAFIVERMDTRTDLGTAALSAPEGVVRQWVAAPDLIEQEKGSANFGAYSYVGASNPTGAPEDVVVTDSVEAREMGAAVPGDAGLPLGSFTVRPTGTGKQYVTIELQLADSSMGGSLYETGAIRREIEVSGEGCPEVRTEPTAEPTIPEATPTFMAPERFPNAVRFEPDFTPVAGSCEDSQRYSVPAAGFDFCLTPPWTLKQDGAQGGLLPEAERTEGYAAYVVLETSAPEGTVTSRLSITAAGTEPFSVTQCPEPVDVVGVKVCAHGPKEGPGHSILMAPAIYLLGMTTSADRWVTLVIYDAAGPSAIPELQAAAIRLVSSIREPIPDAARSH